MPSSPSTSSSRPARGCVGGRGDAATISRPPWVSSCAAHRRSALIATEDGTSGNAQAQHDDGVGRALHLRPLFVDARHLGEQPHAGVVQDGHVVAWALFGNRDDSEVAVVGLLQSHQLRGLRGLDAVEDQRRDDADQDRGVQRQLCGGREGDQHRDRRYRRDAQHQLDVGQPADDELESDDEDEPTDDRHGDELGGRTGHQTSTASQIPRRSRPTGLRASRSRHTGPRERSTAGQRTEEAACEIADALRREVAGHVAPAAVRIRDGRRDSRGLRQRDERDRDPAHQKFGHDGEVRNGQRWKGGDRRDVADGLDLDVCDRDDRGDDDQGEQDRDDSSGLMKWNTAHTATVAAATATAVGCQGRCGPARR